MKPANFLSPQVAILSNLFEIFIVLGIYSSPPYLRYPQLRYFRSYAILNWVPKTPSYAIL